jgi:hypothetical protein
MTHNRHPTAHLFYLKKHTLSFLEQFTALQKMWFFRGEKTYSDIRVQS